MATMIINKKPTPKKARMVFHLLWVDWHTSSPSPLTLACAKPRLAGKRQGDTFEDLADPFPDRSHKSIKGYPMPPIKQMPA